GGGFRRDVLHAVEADFLGTLHFAANVDLRGGIVGHPDDRQSGTHAGLAERSCFTGNLRADLACDFGAVENGSRHQFSLPSRVILNLGKTFTTEAQRRANKIMWQNFYADASQEPGCYVLGFPLCFCDSVVKSVLTVVQSPRHDSPRSHRSGGLSGVQERSGSKDESRGAEVHGLPEGVSGARRTAGTSD